MLPKFNIARTRVVILTLICSITFLMAFESKPATFDRQEVKLTASNGTAIDNVGLSVAISGDTAVVGNPYANVGANGHQGLAYVFVRNGETWSSPQTLPEISGEAADLFGYSVAISGDTVIVGVPGDNVVGNTLT